MKRALLGNISLTPDAAQPVSRPRGRGPRHPDNWPAAAWCLAALLCLGAAFEFAAFGAAHLKSGLHSIGVSMSAGAKASDARPATSSAPLD
jgi:hypothetical protein